MAESRDETTLVTPLEEVGSRAERTFVFWLTNGSHAVNHFQNQMLVLLYAVIAADLGFGIVTVGVLGHHPWCPFVGGTGPVRLRHPLPAPGVATGNREPRPGAGHSADRIHDILCNPLGGAFGSKCGLSHVWNQRDRGGAVWFGRHGC